MKNFFNQHIKIFRRIIQTATIVFICVVPILNHFEFTFIVGTFYSYSFGFLNIADPSIIFQTILLQKNFYVPLIIAGFIPVGIAFIFGRIFCSWMCPFNTFSEISFWLRKKTTGRKKRFLESSGNPASYYFWIFTIFVFALVLILGIPIVTFISAPGIISSQIADGIYTGEIGLELSLIVLILVVEFAIVSRVWCKYLCPVGIFIGIFRVKSTMRVKYNEWACICSEEQAPCAAVCPLKLSPKKQGALPYCYNCGDCITTCQKKYGKALTFNFKK